MLFGVEAAVLLGRGGEIRKGRREGGRGWGGGGKSSTRFPVAVLCSFLFWRNVDDSVLEHFLWIMVISNSENRNKISSGGIPVRGTS